jgi:CHAT domain-containing protein/tetratricopeptide (TPR) repeat protein
MDEYRRAEPLYLEAKKIVIQSLGRNDPRYAALLNNMGHLYGVVGDFSQAERLCLEALGVWKRTVGGKHPSYASSLSNLAEVYRSMGDHRKAKALYEQSLEIRKQTQDEHHPDYGRNMALLAALHGEMGDYARSEQLWRQSLEIKKRTQGTNHPEYATALKNLGAVYLMMGDFRRAEQLCMHARVILKQAPGEHHPLYADTLNELAEIYRSMGDYRRAEPLSLQALEIVKQRMGKSHIRYASALIKLTSIYMMSNEYSRAELLCRQGLELMKGSHGENHFLYAQSLNLLAQIYIRMGDYHRAEPLFEQALKIRKQTLGEHHPAVTSSLFDLSTLYFVERRYEAAERLLGPVLLRESFFVDDAFSVMGERQRFSVVNARRGELALYVSLAARVHVAPERIWGSLLDWRGAVEAAQAQEGLARDQPELRGLYEELRRTRARIANLAFRSASGVGPQVPQTRKLETLLIEKENAERALALRSADYRKATKVGRLGPLEIAGLMPDETAFVDFFEYRHIAPPREGKREVEHEERMSAFVLRKGHPVAQVALGPAKVINGAVASWRKALNGRPGDIDASARELARLIWEPLRPHLADVKTLLLAPDGALTRFPLGALPGRQPGTYLIEEMAIGYLTSGRALARLLSEPAGEPTTARQASGLLAAGAIEYAADPGKFSPPPGQAAPSTSLAKRDLVNVGFQALPGTGREVDHIRDAFLKADPHGRVELLTGGAATEGALKERIGQHTWRYVHLATHGFYESPRRLVAILRAAHAGGASLLAGFRPDDPQEQVLGLLPLLRSGLALAGAERVIQEKRVNNEPDDQSHEDGLFTAEEVASLDMRGTEMVVLSACETGLGDVAGGEGVLGLQRAFHTAGAKSVVASLWKVSDPATSVLMEEFYGNLLEKKLPKLEALRQAQISVLHNPQRVRDRERELKRAPGAKPATLPEGGKRTEPPGQSGPAWWAAFTLSGDYR